MENWAYDRLKCILLDNVTEFNKFEVFSTLLTPTHGHRIRSEKAVKKSEARKREVLVGFRTVYECVKYHCQEAYHIAATAELSSQTERGRKESSFSVSYWHIFLDVLMELATV